MGDKTAYDMTVAVAVQTCPTRQSCFRVSYDPAKLTWHLIQPRQM